MVVTHSWTAFACYSKACAPPPAGKGGSTPGGKTSARGDEPPRSSVSARGSDTPETTVSLRVAAARRAKFNELEVGKTRSVQFGDGKGNHYDASLNPVEHGYRLKVTKRGSGASGSGPLGRSQAAKTLVDRKYEDRALAVNLLRRAFGN